VDYQALPPAELVVHCLRTGEEFAWIEFVRRFQPLIASVAIRVSRQWGETSRSVVDDLIQETYLKLCTDRLRLLDNFKSRHDEAIYGYIKVFTANLVHDHFKASNAQKRGRAVETASINDERKAEYRIHVESTEVLVQRKLLLGEVAACLEGIAAGPGSERDRRIFWLYYRVGLSARAIATLPTIGLSTKGVESTILRLTRAVRRHLTAQKSSASAEGITPENSF
jgi:RNA polymerase sigma-70 factor (ECF subfamily)